MTESQVHTADVRELETTEQVAVEGGLTFEIGEAYEAIKQIAKALF